MKHCLYYKDGECTLETIQLNKDGICLDCDLRCADKFTKRKRRELFYKPLTICEFDENK